MLHRKSAEELSKSSNAAALAEARAGKAVAMAETEAPSARSAAYPGETANTAEWRDSAAHGILKMERFVSDAGKAAAGNQEEMQARIKTLKNMSLLRAEVFHFQAELRQQMSRLSEHSDKAQNESWVKATAVNLESVFQRAEAEVEAHAMPARQNTVPDADSDSDVFEDARLEFDSDSDSDSDSDTEVDTEVSSHEGTDIDANTDTDTDASQVQSEPPEATVSPRAGETSMPTPPADRDASVDATVISTDHVAGSAATEAPPELSESAANAVRDGMARDLLRLNTMYMGYHVSGVLDLVGNVRAMDRRIAKLEELLAQKEEMLQDHADLKEQLADPNLPARLEWSQFKLWRAAAEMRPEDKFDELAASISDIRASMNRGVEALIWDKGYKRSEIFKKD
ncbi:hypothetical protein [Paracidovorax anthurii]|uniref:hypothetical protein n=1 Tax=Paracidovorax anthurii TaxID=78229 RepID=UPI0011BDDB71|nr:hypothetical protein [Paracidovorax anthurii]